MLVRIQLASRWTCQWQSQRAKALVGEVVVSGGEKAFDFVTEIKAVMVDGLPRHICGGQRMGGRSHVFCLQGAV